MGNYSGARDQAQYAREMAVLLGDILEHAQALATEARCCLSTGAFPEAARLCARARELLGDCGLQGTFVDLRFENFAAEIHHLKTEYPEARAIHARLAIGSSGAQQAANASPFDLLNLATIDAEMGAESAGARQSLEAARLQFTTTMWSPPGVLLCDAVSATLFLRDGNTSTAQSMFETLFTRL